MKKKTFWTIVRTIVIAVIIAVFFRSYLFASYVVDGKSMEPTLHDGDLLMVNKVVYDWHDINRFDVIVFHANDEEDYVKRVIGLPGDHIEFKDDSLYVNAIKINETYLEPLKATARNQITEDFSLEEKTGTTIVPEGKLFVMGDNRKDSYDSRYFGFIETDTVVGKVDIIYWPMSQLAFSLTK
ncbi:signal peptidase I [Radiobacillus sp. PE A8.2]|uniref:signal peptidase I n=1 Tax=Radiobacillus sp. PE A8.2 TaxID=3380349 RepID=UPI00388EDCE4